MGLPRTPTVQRAIDPQGGLKLAYDLYAIIRLLVQRAIDPQGGLKRLSFGDVARAA